MRAGGFTEKLRGIFARFDPPSPKCPGDERIGRAIIDDAGLARI